MVPALSVARETRTRIPKGRVHLQLGLGIQSCPSYVSNNADDYQRIAIIPIEERFPYWIRFRPKFSRHSLVDDHGALVLLVSGSKFPPAQQRNVQRLKVVRRQSAAEAFAQSALAPSAIRKVPQSDSPLSGSVDAAATDATPGSVWSRSITRSR